MRLRGSVLIEGLYSWGAVVEVGGQHCFSSVGQEERCEPYGSVRGRSQALEDHWEPSILIESLKDVWLKSLEDHAIGTFDLTISTWMSDRGPIDLDAVSITEVQELLPGEVCSMVSDDTVRNTKMIDDVKEELDCLF